MAFDLEAFQREVLSDPLVQDVWNNKYRLRAPDGSWEEASIEVSKRRMVEALYKNDDPKHALKALDFVQRGIIVPGGRVHAGAGTGRNVTLINCYVSEPVQDSIPGIQYAINRAAYTMQQGGGIGTDYSTLRPAGALVNRTGSVASGALSFASQQDAMCKTIVSAGTRRGAMMLTLRDDHPDLWNPNQWETATDFTGKTFLKSPSFITIKTQPGVLTQFNISVLVSDAFMHAVEVDGDWDLGFHVPPADGKWVDCYPKPFPYDYVPIDNEGNLAVAVESDNPFSNYINKGAMLPWYVYHRVKARMLWEEIMRATYKYAEPGVIFIDQINNRNNLRYCEEIRCTNPCFTGDTKVWTTIGPVPFSELAKTGNDVPVLTILPDGKLAYRVMSSPRMTQRDAQLVKVTVQSKRGIGGQKEIVTSFRCTPTHEVFTVNLDRIQVKDLSPGDCIESACRIVANQKEYVDSSSGNVRVVSVEYLDAHEDVYCGTVTDTGRFFVSLGDDHYEGVLVSNCGEQPLPPNGACDLGSINLAFLVHKPFTSDATFDMHQFGEAVETAVRLLDNVLDVTNYPLTAQRMESMQKRRIGLGVTGWGSALIQLGIEFGSLAATKLGSAIAHRLQYHSYRASMLLAKERGPFPLFDPVEFGRSPNVHQLPAELRYEIAEHGIRNGVLNTVAPNGTISVYSGNVSSGIEPVFSFAKTIRKVRQPDNSIKEYASCDYSYRLWEAMNGPTPVDQLPAYFVSAMQLSPHKHVADQAVWQEYIDASISKTINCATDLPLEEFMSLYSEAYKSGCKGCTTYRYDPDAGRGSVLQEVSAKPTEPLVPEPETPATASSISAPITVRERPARTDASSYKIKWPITGANWYVHVTRDEKGVPLEVFISTRIAEYQEWVTAFSCLLTAVLRRGGDYRFLIKELKQIMSATGGAFVSIGDVKHPERYPSIVAAIGGVLEAETKRLNSGASIMQTVMAQDIAEIGMVAEQVAEQAPTEQCPQCGGTSMVHEQGCLRCLTCDYSQCG